MGYYAQDKYAHLIAREYNFVPYDDVKYEVSMTPERKFMFTIAKRTHAANILVLFDFEEYEKNT
jgi:hypothetical protein